MSESAEQQLDQLNREVVRLYGQGRYEHAVAVANRASGLARQDLAEANTGFAASLTRQC